jgi:hypothetical protein
VSIPFNFGEAGPEEHYTEGPRPYDFETADPGCLPDIAGAIAPRPVLTQAAVDGRNRPLTLAERTTGTEPRKANITVREEPDPGILADWIVANLR